MVFALSVWYDLNDSEKPKIANHRRGNNAAGLVRRRSGSSTSSSGGGVVGVSTGKSSSTIGAKTAIWLIASAAIISILWCVLVDKPDIIDKQASETKILNEKGVSFTEKDFDHVIAQDFLKQTSSGLRRSTTPEDGIEYLWQAPAVNKGQRHPKVSGILFVAHGCSHSATDWWDQDDLCHECLGLPEEKAIVNLAVNELHMILVAVSSINRQHRCWSKADGPRVAKVLQHLVSTNDILQQQQQQQQTKQTSVLPPIFAFGASSGGMFVSSILPNAMMGQVSSENGTDGVVPLRLSGYICQIMAPRIPPTIPAVFISMNRDDRTDSFIENMIQELDDTSSRATTTVKHIRIDPLPITDTFFSDRIGGTTIDADLSRTMVHALREGNFLSEKGFLREDPRESDWRSALLEQPDIASHLVHDKLVPDESPISEVMNVAYARHEMTRDGVKEALSFLLEQ